MDMQRIRVKVQWLAGSWGVDLPNYQMVPGSWLPVVAGVTTAHGVLSGVNPANPEMARLSCLVDVPDDDCDRVTHLPSMEVIRQRYAGQDKWGASDYTPDITPSA